MKRRIIPLAKPFVDRSELAGVEKTLESGWLAQGPRVREFERKLAAYLGARHVVATSSCTTALSLAVESLGLAKGGRIVVPDFTFPATANIVVKSDCKLGIADVSLETYGVDPADLAKRITRGTSAAIPVHPFGHPFAVSEVYELAEKRGMEIIEDAATAIGTEYKGRRIGSRGRAVCFSFHPRKLITTAEGGALVTDDAEVGERAAELRNHGQVARKGKVVFDRIGLNYRMSDVHAAIGLAQIKKLDRIIRSRRKQAKVYNELIADAGIDVKPPTEMLGAFHTYQSYVVLFGKSLAKKRDYFIRTLRHKRGIETQVGTYSLHLQPSFSGLADGKGLRNGGALYHGTMALPAFVGLTEEEQGYVISSLQQLAGS